MWVVKGLLFLILLFVLVWFFAANSDQSVDLNVFGRSLLGINIYWVVAVCYLLGFATSFVLAAVRELRFHRELGQLRKAVKTRDREIADLRTLPLRDEPAPRPGCRAVPRRQDGTHRAARRSRAVTGLLIVPAAAVVAVVGILLWRSLRSPGARTGDDGYQQALELWVAGEREEAVRMLTAVVKANPTSVDPFLTLGNLLRRRGDFSRAAVLHRGLTLRPELPRPKKLAVGLALAEDLVALERWDEAREVLDTVMKDATGRASYWKVRFAQWQGQGNLPEAARTLKAAPRFVPERERPWFVAAYAAFQLDRALAHAAAGEAAEARARLKDVEKIPGAVNRAALVRAVLAAVSDDAHEAVTVASEELLDTPEELSIFLPLLQEVLLRTGQYARTIPILERACQAENAPPSLWISLALLYEKLDERGKALRLLEAKAGRPAFTPDAAEPYLRVLMREAGGTDAARVWAMLSRPTRPGSWTCSACGRREESVRWFCETCRAFDSFNRDRRSRKEP